MPKRHLARTQALFDSAKQVLAGGVSSDARRSVQPVPLYISHAAGARLWDVDGGTTLGNWVNTSDGDCADVYDGPNDDIALCASYFTNGWLFYYRIATILGLLNVGLKANAFYYGMISDGSNNFPRGQAMYSLTSVGPSGTPCSPLWPRLRVGYGRHLRRLVCGP